MKFSNPLRIIRNLLLFFFVSTTVMVVVYRFVPVYVTPLMVIRSVQQVFKGESPAWHHEWVPFDRISPHLPMAVIASEDNRFATHNGFDFIENRFFVRGEGNILYNFNGGRLTKDPNIAAQMFLRTFETVPPLLEKYQKEVEQISKDIPILQEVVKETWKKEDQLKQLKSDLAALDRKIQLSLKPVKQNEDSNSKDESQAENKGHGITPSPGAPSATSPASDGKPYVHQPPDFLSAPPEKKPPHLNQPPVSFSIKDAMNSLGNKLVIGGIPKPGNKDDPDPDQSQRPKPKLKL